MSDCRFGVSPVTILILILIQNVLDLVYIWCLENVMLVSTQKRMLIASRQKRRTLRDGNLKLVYNNLEL